MIENTLENKVKFFFLHYGQRIWRYPHSNGQKALLYVDAGTVHDKSYLGFQGHLELKPLSSITDEDAIEVQRIVTTKKDVDMLFNTLSKEKALFECRYTAEYNKHYQVVDFLRSRGYLLPYMGLTPDEILSYGWAKYKEV